MAKCILLSLVVVFCFNSSSVAAEKGPERAAIAVEFVQVNNLGVISVLSVNPGAWHKSSRVIGNSRNVVASLQTEKVLKGSLDPDAGSKITIDIQEEWERTFDITNTEPEPWLKAGQKYIVGSWTTASVSKMLTSSSARIFFEVSKAELVEDLRSIVAYSNIPLSEQNRQIVKMLNRSTRMHTFVLGEYLGALVGVDSEKEASMLAPVVLRSFGSTFDLGAQLSFEDKLLMAVRSSPTPTESSSNLFIKEAIRLLLVDGDKDYGTMTKAQVRVVQQYLPWILDTQGATKRMLGILSREDHDKALRTIEGFMRDPAVTDSGYQVTLKCVAHLLREGMMNATQ